MIGETLRVKKEFDVSDDIWKIYRLMYRENLPDDFPIIEKGRKHIEAVFKNGERSSAKKLYFSGDTDINFTNGFAHSRLKCYKDLICQKMNNEKDKTRYLKSLDIIEKLTYSIVNVSLIPQSGNLQSVKQGIGNDRIDTFIWALAEYYAGNSCLLFNHSAYGTLDYLKDYLSLFESVYDYCKVIYHIDNPLLVDDMIESGKYAVDSPKRVIELMKLASGFWQQKYRYLYDKSLEDNQIEIQKALEKVNIEIEKLRFEN